MAPDNQPSPTVLRRVDGDISHKLQMGIDFMNSAPKSVGRLWWLVAAVLAAGVGLRIFLSMRTDFTIGDAFIGFRFAEQFAAGNGLVFNAGEWVGGNTSSLNTLLLGLGACSGMGVPLVARILGIACDVGALFVMWHIFRGESGIRSPLLQVAALAVVFLSPFLFFYSVSGLETPLYILLVVFVLDRTLRKLDWRWCLGVGLLFFCRPDGVVAVGVALLFHTLVNRKIPWQALVWTFLIGLGYLGFNHFVYHSAIPATVKIKATIYHSSVASLFQYIADRFFFHRAWLLGGYLSLMLALMVVRRSRPAVLLLGLTALGYLLFDLTAPTLRTWYVVPFLTLSACTILLATASLAEDTRLRYLDPAVFGALAVYVLASSFAYRAVFRECRIWRERIHELTEAAGTWLRDNTPPDTKVFVTALETGYFAKRRTWDWPGLVAPQIPKLIQADPKIDLLGMADRVQADYAVVPDEVQKDGHPNFRRVKVFETEKSAAHMGFAKSSYSVYRRVDATMAPVTR